MRTASAEGRELATTVKERASEVRDEAVHQGQGLLQEARAQLESQAGQQSRRLAMALVRLGNEAEALAAGRTEQAATLSGWMEQCGERSTEAGDRLYGFADDIEQRGITAVLDDVSDFARRRPGAFLLGAALVGFGVARVVRGASAPDPEEAGSRREWATSGSSGTRRAR